MRLYLVQHGQAFPADEHPDRPLTDPGRRAVEAVAALLEHQQLRAMLTELREDYRTVLVLRFLSELSPEETAHAMGRSAGAVRVLQHRALAALRSMMKSAPGEG